MLDALRTGGGLDIPTGAKIVPYNTSLVWMVVDSDGRSLRIASRQSMGELLRHGFTVTKEDSGLTRVTVNRPLDGSNAQLPGRQARPEPSSTVVSGREEREFWGLHRFREGLDTICCTLCGWGYHDPIHPPSS
jgi:hypothetical protein